MWVVWSLVSCLALLIRSAHGGSFYQDIDLIWGQNKAKIMGNGRLLELVLDRESGSGFKSKNDYLFGRIDVQLKLVAGNSAGTVTTFYMTSLGDAHDEIDFEFLGNLSGDPYVLHTNIYAQGKGNREMQFYLWFDPTRNFHTYSILWNPQRIIFLVDGIPIREFKNNEAAGVPFPRSQAMGIRGSLWDADNWATRGGLVKTDWSQAPFRAFYRDLAIDACAWWTSPACAARGWYRQGLSRRDQRRMRWVQRRYMIYDYCKDVKRFWQGLPRECKLPAAA
ncbi:hypothetical protein Taro_037585 [Colocasia esculenta]|uniref:Xyloglucan endotransglucosylase/hydrolase n=1 Tax=Colocasia esculenta TaxID=4460 RepID=A0A843W4I6_COLES|nr:hypothetical protein [Colocasia esculenta]